MSSGKVHNLVGNIANQKYEASRNIERHIQIINHTSPSQETTRWKDSQPYYFTKQEGRLVVDEKRLNEDNLLMNQRLHNVAAENRTLQAHEHAPGWRAGKCGMFIDCYPSSNHQKVLDGMARNNHFSRSFAHHKVEKENLLILKFLESARSSYEREDLRRKYERNRVAYNLFNSKTPNYALHLGLVKAATERIERRDRLAAMHYSAISAPSVRRPTSAPSMHRYDRQILKDVDKIHDIHDFYDLKEIDRAVRNPHGHWDPSTNDNIHNSGYNIVESTATSIYKQKKRIGGNYLNDRAPDISQVAAQLQSEQAQAQAQQAAQTAPKTHQPSKRMDLLDIPPEKLRPKSKKSKSKAPHDAAEPKHSKVDAMQKLSMMRKNVSFKELQEDQEAEPAPMRRGSIARKGSSDEDDQFDARGLKKKMPSQRGMPRMSSTVSELDTDEDPTIPRNHSHDEFHRRKSLILDSHFLDSVPLKTLPEEGASTAGEAMVSSCERVLQSLQLHFSSKFHLPVRCHSLEYPHYKVLGIEDCPVEAVHISLFDIGYFLPGSEEYNRYMDSQLRPESSHSNAHTLTGALGSRSGSSFHTNAGASFNSKPKARSPIGQSVSSPALRGVQGLSLPTSTGFLLAVSVAADEAGIEPVFQYFTLHEAMTAGFSNYPDSLPKAVFSEMMAFAYPFGSDMPTVTPRDVNSCSVPKGMAKAQVVVDADCTKALVVPCLTDMMETEILLGFINAVVDHITITWDKQRQKLVLDCT